jgi:hypothetical protein
MEEVGEKPNDANNKRKASEEDKNSSAKKSKTPQKAPQSGGKAAKLNSYG